MMESFAVQGLPEGRSLGVRDLVTEAVCDNDAQLGYEAAAAWGGDFRIPPAFVAKCEEDLAKVGGDLAALALQRQQALADSRMSHERVAALSPDNPARERLHGLVEGMPIPVAHDFVPNGNVPGVGTRLRPSYVRTAAAVNKMLFEQGDSKLCLVVRREVADQIPGVHYSPLAWTPKKGKASGRPIGDLSDGDGGHPLNSEETKVACESLWGPIVHPTLQQLVRMIFEFYQREKAKDPDFAWEDIVLFKLDLKNAFTLLFFRPEVVRLLAFPMSFGLVLFLLCGVFGWTGTPFGFNPVTIGVVHEVRARIYGDAGMFVDDLMGVSTHKIVMQDVYIVVAIVEALLGPGAIAMDKTLIGRVMEWIGWMIDLERRRVYIAPRNVLKAVHGFFSVSSKCSLQELQRLASWASRYGEVHRWMRPHSSRLHSAATGEWWSTRPGVKLEVSSGAFTAIQLWRAMLCLGVFAPDFFCRSLHTYAYPPAQYVVQFDASLQGLGVLWWRLTGDGGEFLLGGASMSLARLGFGDDSRFQNTAEYMAVVVGLAGLMAFFGARDEAVVLRGDSVTALEWSRRDRSRSAIAWNTATVQVAVCAISEIWVEGVVHVPGVDNTVCDGLSRGVDAQDLALPAGTPVLCLDGDELFEDLLSLCSPLRPSDARDSFLSLWKEAWHVVASLQARGPPHRTH